MTPPGAGPSPRTARHRRGRRPRASGPSATGHPAPPAHRSGGPTARCGLPQRRPRGDRGVGRRPNRHRDEREGQPDRRRPGLPQASSQAVDVAGEHGPASPRSPSRRPPIGARAATSADVGGLAWARLPPSRRSADDDVRRAGDEGERRAVRLGERREPHHPVVADPLAPSRSPGAVAEAGPDEGAPLPAEDTESHRVVDDHERHRCRGRERGQVRYSGAGRLQPGHQPSVAHQTRP